MEPQRLAAGQGWQWIKQGYALFMKSPVIWFVLSLISFITFTLIEKIPGLGTLISILIAPVIVAGLLLGCRTLEQNGELELFHLFAGFQRNTSRLISLGGVVLLTLILISGMIFLIGGETIMKIVEQWKPTDDPEAVMRMLGENGLSLLFKLFLVVSIPLILLSLTMQFAPMLIVFNNLSTLAAMQTSFKGFLCNIAPLSVYSIIVAFMFLFPKQFVLPDFLYTLIVLVIFPTVIASSYACYCDIFPAAKESAQPSAQSDAFTPGEEKF